MKFVINRLMKSASRILLLNAFICLSLGAAGHAAGPKYSLREWNSIANLFRVVIDEGVNKPEQPSKRYCGLTHDIAQDRILEVQAEIDGALKKEEKELKKPLEILKRAQSCESRCHCGMYSDLLEKVPPEELKGLGRGDKTRIRDIHHFASTLTPGQAAVCARKTALWFCGSDFLKKGL